MIKSKTNVSLEIDEAIKEYLNVLHQNVNFTIHKTKQLEQDITDKLYEVNSMIQDYNENCGFIRENIEEANEMLGGHISDFSNALFEKQTTLSEEAYESLDEWIKDWEEFNSGLTDLDWITNAEEVDQEDSVFCQNTEDSLKELERHICYNQPSHSINVEDKEEETV